MFLSGSLRGGNLGVPDPEKERDPPAEPTPVTFPSHEAPEGRAWTVDSPPPHFRTLFSKILKPTDISYRHEQALNIDILPSCSVDDLIPSAIDGSSYLPSLPKEGDVDADATTLDQAAARKQKDLEQRVTELRIDNDLAFQVLNKTVPPDVKPPRLAYMRKFWEGLESMSQYWDCSLDHYYEVHEPATFEENGAKRQRLESGSSDTSNAHDDFLSYTDHKTSYSHDQSRSNNNSEMVAESRDGDDSNTEPVANGGKRSDEITTAAPQLTTSMRYKGRRTATGRAMPDQFRADTARAFVEGTIWPFRASLSPPRMMPIVQFDKLNLPVRQTAAVYRMPNDRIKARQGWQEGPMLSVQTRSDTDFKDENEQPLEDKSRLDSMREIGGLLQLAQERRREGKTEDISGEGKWWTTKPRWGGGSGGKVQNEEGNTDIVTAAEEFTEGSKGGNDKQVKPDSRSRKKKTPAVLWKELKPGRGQWDPKTEYTAIGTDPASAYDIVFLVSSLNHHISIVKMTVHGAYVDTVTSGEMPDPTPEDELWCRPRVERSPWYDLLNVDQRLEAFRGLWGVMAYLTRQPSQ